jgi:uncharacterized membrane protein
MSWLSILLAFVSSSVLNISQAGQKLGLALMRRNRFRGGLLWTGSLLGTSVAALIGWYAVSIGSASLVGAMMGSGLASLTVFSALVLKERIRVREIIGIVLLVGSGVLIGLFRVERPTVEPSLLRLFLFLGSLSLSALLWLALRRHSRIVGPIVAGFAGALGGFVPLFQKVASSATGRGLSFLANVLEEGHWALAVTGPFTLLWAALSVASMIVIQFAYRHDRAVRLIPYFTSCSILVPVIGGVLALGERLRAPQWLGVTLILAGLLLLTLPGSDSSP